MISAGGEPASAPNWAIHAVGLALGLDELQRQADAIAAAVLQDDPMC